MEYVALLRHSPESCPGSNAKVRERAEQAMGKMEEGAKKHRVELKSSHVLAPKHLVVMVFEAPGIEAVRDFLDEGGVTQWNDTELYPSMGLQEVMQIQGPPPIW